jgi:uncharacterized protein YjbK
MPRIETELKYLLGRASFCSLYRYLKEKEYESSITRQVNYYFSPRDLSPSPRFVSTRIRHVQDAFQGSWELTCKVSIDETTTDTVQNSYEYNANLSGKEALNYIGNGLPEHAQKQLLGDLRQAHGIPMRDLFCIGHLRTSRFAFNVKDDLPALLLDINLYLGIFDYEIEWELKETELANALLQRVFNELDIKPVGRLQPKVKRFFDRLMKNDSILV